MGIWTDQTGEPPVPVDVPIEDATLADTSKPPQIKKEGLPVRAGGDRIWLLLGGKKRWITSAAAYEKLGFKFGDEKDIDAETLAVIPEGTPIQ